MLIKLRSEEGVALVIVLVAVVILSALGASLTISSLRDLDTSTSVRRASSALALAEAGVQHAIEKLRGGQPLPGPALTGAVPDNSSDGNGQWMNPACQLDLSISANADACLGGPSVFVTGDPNRPGPYEGIPPGSDGSYTVFIGVKTPVNIEAKAAGFYRIVATGHDRRGSVDRPGVSTVWQDIRIQALEIPFTMFAEQNFRVGGQNVVLRNLSAYSGQNMLFRDSLTFEATPAGYPNPCPPRPSAPTYWPTGCDLMYRHDPDGASGPSAAETGPAAAHAGGAKTDTGLTFRGTIYKGNGLGNPDINGPIHPDPSPLHPTVNCSYPYDRDGYGGAWPAAWPCDVAPFNAPGPPPYENTGPCFAATGGKNLGSCLAELPFNPDLPDPPTYEQLKAIAKRTNTYCGPSSCFESGGGTLTVEQDDLPDPAATPFFVLYVEGGRNAAITQLTRWGSQTRPPEAVSPCTGHMGIVVVRDGDLTWNATEVWWGAAFVPEGEFSGGGGGADAWIVGTVKANSMGSTGNIKFQLNNCWKISMPGFNFSIVRERWHQPNQ